LPIWSRRWSDPRSWGRSERRLNATRAVLLSRVYRSVSILLKLTPSILSMPLICMRTLLAAAVGVSALSVVGARPPLAAEVAPRAAHSSQGVGVNKYVEVCAACHQLSGLGIEGAFPPLAGSEWVLGRADVPIAIVLHGVQGEITVKGKKYNSAMMAWGGVINDDDLAATLTYVRTQWGNRAAPVTAAQVKAVRAKLAQRTTPFTAAELQALK